MQNKVLEYINTTMEKVNIVKEVIGISNHINMTYNYLTDEVSFDSKRIAQILNHYPHISLRDYVTTFTLHELGHSLDRENLLLSYDQTVQWYKLSKELNSQEKKSNPLYLELSYLEDKANLKFEQVAWINAIRLNNEFNLVPNHLLNELKADSLLTYEENYNFSKELFDRQKQVPMPA